MASLEQIQGCLLGLALGDAYGAPLEGGFLERCLWRVVGRTWRGKRRWTDDTQMSIDIVESLLATGSIDPDDLATRFAKSYRWSRGYGPGAARLLKRIGAGADWREVNCSVYPNGSFGNGAAMRAPVIGLFYANRVDELPSAVESASIVTHAHPLAVEGALLVARATAGAMRGEPTSKILEQELSSSLQEEFVSRLVVAQEWLQTDREASKKDVNRVLGNRIAAHESCVTALYLALRFRNQPFLAMHQFIASCGGDTDTIGAMAGAIWGAANGSSRLPSQWLGNLEQYERLSELSVLLHRKSHTMVDAGSDSLRRQS